MPVRKLPLPTQERIMELLSYDPHSGHFTRRINRGGAAIAGARAGTLNNIGYRSIKIDGRFYVCSRLAFRVMTGGEPAEEIDHINGDKDDNRWCNLREASRAQNMRNRRGRGKSSYRGAYPRPSGKFVAAITINGKNHHLGMFHTAEEAQAAYAAAARLLDNGSYRRYD